MDLIVADVEVDVFTLALEPKDMILLCSDGLWGEVSDTNLEFILNSHPDLRVVAQKLLQASHIGGGKDNCTHILFQVS